MRISKQISGNAARRGDAERQGRGEYEWCQLTESDPTRDLLLGRRIRLSMPDGIVVDTGCILDGQGGKNRVRLDADTVGRREVYPHYHIGAALLMPRTTRREQNWGDGLPVLRNEQYSITDIQLGALTLSADGRDVVAEVRSLVVQNCYRVDDIDVAVRFASVQHAWRDRGQLDPELSELLEQHEMLIRSGGIISTDGQPIVQDIQDWCADITRDSPALAGSSAVEDSLPALIEMLGVRVHQESPAIPIDQIPPDQPLIRRRAIREQRLVAARMATAAQFRRLVREAYDSTCLVCGTRLPAAGPGGNPGVDSCHILPYSEYDLDLISNGICLCKMHHWTFDEGLIGIVPVADGYAAEVSEESIAVSLSAGMTPGWLVSQVGPIPNSRLPQRREDWPRPEYLERLRTILYPQD